MEEKGQMKQGLVRNVGLQNGHNVININNNNAKYQFTTFKKTVMIIIKMKVLIIHEKQMCQLTLRNCIWMHCRGAMPKYKKENLPSLD